ncbi:hypothetical protein [Streptomyces tremellae]|uniref:Helix-turn-helix domain-containing protein n=1 Tax=Streptomyces tremellae TaxID=1124239 RepID=A0ABP7EIY6_9ACTN
MPTKADRVVALPAGLVPLLTQPELETYYQISDWTVLQWIKAGLPVEEVQATGAKKRVRRFDLAVVKRWLAERDQLAASA